MLLTLSRFLNLPETQFPLLWRLLGGLPAPTPLAHSTFSRPVLLSVLPRPPPSPAPCTLPSRCTVYGVRCCILLARAVGSSFQTTPLVPPGSPLPGLRFGSDFPAILHALAPRLLSHWGFVPGPVLGMGLPAGWGLAQGNTLQGINSACASES